MKTYVVKIEDYSGVFCERYFDTREDAEDLINRIDIWIDEEDDGEEEE